MVVEEKLHDTQVNPNLNCILVILCSRRSPTENLMQREDIILEWIFLPHKTSKKFKSYVGKSLNYYKRKIETSLTSRKTAEIIVPFTADEI